LRKRRNTDFIWFFIIAVGVFVLMFFVVTPRSPIPTVLVLAAVTSVYILLAERKTRRIARDQASARRKKASAQNKHKLSRRRDAEFGKVIEFPHNKASK
jgi:uncharacterized membrane protein (DUF106 family)